VEVKKTIVACCYFFLNSNELYLKNWQHISHTHKTYFRKSIAALKPGVTLKILCLPAFKFLAWHDPILPVSINYALCVYVEQHSMQRSIILMFVVK